MLCGGKRCCLMLCVQHLGHYMVLCVQHLGHYMVLCVQHLGHYMMLCVQHLGHYMMLCVQHLGHYMMLTSLELCPHSTFIGPHSFVKVPGQMFKEITIQVTFYWFCMPVSALLVKVLDHSSSRSPYSVCYLTLILILSSVPGPSWTLFCSGCSEGDGSVCK